LRQNRSGCRPQGHDRFHPRERRPGVLGGAEARQARHARLAHRRTGVSGCRGVGRERAWRRRRRRQGADERPRLRARGAQRRSTGNANVAAKNDSAFSGGTKKEVTVVAKRDQDKLLADLTKSLQERAFSELEKKLSDDQVLIKLI